MNVEISKSNKEGKKLKAVIDNKKTIHVGASGYSDQTKHKDDDRKERYLSRHKKREDHTKSGIKTAGFLSAGILWNKPSIEASINDLNKKYKDVKFTYKKSNY